MAVTVNDHIRHPESIRDLGFTITSGNVTVGTFVKKQDTWGILYNANDCFGTKIMTVGKSASIHYYCQKILVPKLAGTAYAIVEGDNLYFSATDKKVSPTKAGTYTSYCGVARAAASATATEVLADINMMFVNLTAA